jgi:hypothetical protein
MNSDKNVAKKNDVDDKLESALNYAKLEALPGLAVQLLSVLSCSDRKDAWPSIKKKIKEFAG